MRIISGKYKGRKITGFETEGIRPTKSLVRESLIAIIQKELLDATVLDLFAGTGAVGLEMLSNGAKKVLLNDKESIKLLKENTINFDNIELLSFDAFKCLSLLKNRDQIFDIIFIDPPYNYDQYEKLARIISEKQLLNNNGYLIIEVDDKKSLQLEGYELVKHKRYGNSSLLFYQLLYTSA